MTQPHTVNDAIVKAFTAKVEQQFETEMAASQAVPTMRRGAHPKHHGIVRATFTVASSVPHELQIGLFREAATFPAYVRFSNSGRGVDSDKDAHGMAIKLLGAPTGMLDDERFTQDFVLVDAPVFVARSPEDFAEFLTLRGQVAASKAPAEVEQLQATILRRFPNVKTLQTLIANPLTVPYWSQVPYALGEHMAVKYKCVPRALDMTPPAGALGHDYLRDAMRQRLSAADPVVFDFTIQVGLAEMPIDDPTVEWSETASVPCPVATLTIEPQPFEDARQMTFAENVVFSPWHTTADHRPLGRINDSRREVYLRMQTQRHGANGVTSKEPTGTDDF